MTRTKSRQAIAQDICALEAVERLLLKYPDVSQEDRVTIAAFLNHGAAIDIGLLSSNSDAWAKAEQFRAENAHHFALRRSVFVYWLLALLAIGSTLILLKDLGRS